MPLFGKNKHNDGFANDQVDQTGQYPADNTTRHGNKLSKTHHQDPLYPSPNAPMPMNYETGRYHGNMGNNVGTAGTVGPGAGAGFDQSNNPNIGPGGASNLPMAPRTDASGNPAHPGSTGRGGGPSRTVGKIESALGTAVGSQSLKARGLAKEQEANALRAQAAELGEAERLEQTAIARRERAVAHGAHPDHGHLGGRNPGAGAPNLDELGGGAGYGVTGAGGAGSAARGGY